MIITKSPREISLMKEAGKIIIEVFEKIEPLMKSGVTTLEISQKCDEIITSRGGRSASKGYYGYPEAVCVSVNDTLVHGIPSKHIVLHEGDIVSVDVVVEYHGYHADAARTYPVGIISDKNQELIDVTKQCFFEAVSKVKEGAYLGDISHAIQAYAESKGYSVPRDYTGHGIGSKMHEDPSIPNYGIAGVGPILKAGMTLAIEPMIASGKPQVRVLGDGWTAKMKDGKNAAHYENTVVVTATGAEIITYKGETN